MQKIVLSLNYRAQFFYIFLGIILEITLSIAGLGGARVSLQTGATQARVDSVLELMQV